MAPRSYAIGITRPFLRDHTDPLIASSSELPVIDYFNLTLPAFDSNFTQLVLIHLNTHQTVSDTLPASHPTYPDPLRSYLTIGALNVFNKKY
jgi:hypothetical protein